MATLQSTAPRSRGTAAPRFVPDRRICSSAFLQQLVYYNAFWSAAWILAHAARIGMRFRKGLLISDPDAVRTVLTVLWLLAEPPRLLAGHAGNLGENVPWLVAFAALTLAPQTAVCYYMMVAQWYLTPLDRALQVVTAALLHSELIATAVTIWRMLRAQRRQFFLFEAAMQQQQQRRQQQWRQRQEDAMEEMDPGPPFSAWR